MSTHAHAIEIMRSMIPISRFNKGEAARIFDEVSESGMKIAVKNNKPSCVLLSLERYEKLLEEIDDLYLMLEVENRLANSGRTYSELEVMKRHGITEHDLEGFEEIELE